MDTPPTIERIRAKDSVAVKFLRGRAGRYPSHNEIVVSIKLLDLHDNIDLTRLLLLNDRDLVRADKYHCAIRFLKQKQNGRTN